MIYSASRSIAEGWFPPPNSSAIAGATVIAKRICGIESLRDDQLQSGVLGPVRAISVLHCKLYVSRFLVAGKKRYGSRFGFASQNGFPTPAVTLTAPTCPFLIENHWKKHPYVSLKNSPAKPNAKMATKFPGGSGNTHVLKIGPKSSKCTVSIRHGGNIGPTSSLLRPAGPNLAQLRPNLAPRWRNLASTRTHLAASSAQVEVHMASKMRNIAGPIRNLQTVRFHPYVHVFSACFCYQ